MLVQTDMVNMVETSFEFKCWSSYYFSVLFVIYMVLVKMNKPDQVFIYLPAIHYFMLQIVLYLLNTAVKYSWSTAFENNN